MVRRLQSLLVVLQVVPLVQMYQQASRKVQLMK
jgi:hypothetical protein